MSDNDLRITRRFDAAPERVFDAWLDPRTTGRWLFTTPTSQSHSAEHDARVGGRWTITDRREDTDFTAIGEYLEIDRPRRLVFTFGMPQFSPEFARVIVEIAPDGDGCIMTLIQENEPAGGRRKALEEGWNAMFGELAKVLG